MPAHPDIGEVVVRGPAQLGQTIRRVRELRGIDQASLAELSDLHRTYVSKIENDTPADTLGRLLRMLRVLDLELVIRPAASGDDR
ncbi:MAG TPA: helix-turn-helix transcriptional regulator [Ilumatobacter sp.]|nr:helix-turn-helix transcriptional regulator [Ilumatobacter sp.]